MGSPFTKDGTSDSFWAEAQAGAKTSVVGRESNAAAMFASEHKDLPGPVDAGKPE
jgi:hypothetical protein